jgi:uncharacterized membrane protein
MERIKIIDNLRGIAFLFMILQHVFYFYDVSNDYRTLYSSIDIIYYSGLFARVLFILLSGYSIYMNYNKNKKTNFMKRLKRSFEILFHGMIITLLTYVLYPNYFIRFGILHFLALGTFIISFLAPYKLASVIILLLLTTIKYPNINSYIDLITGTNSPSFMMDWFPLNKWLPLLLFGLVIGQNLDIKTLDIPILEFDNFITGIGINSLNLYTIHVVILLIFYKFLNNKVIIT